MKNAELAEKIRETLDQNGWAKHAYIHGSRCSVTCQRIHTVGEHCLVGALDSVTDDYSSRAAHPLAAIIAEQFPDRAVTRIKGADRAAVIVFNDHKHTTWDDINLVLEKLAVKEDG